MHIFHYYVPYVLYKSFSTMEITFFSIVFPQLIGRTPLVFLNKVSEGCGAYIAVKQEMMQPTASIKDRFSLPPVIDVL